MPTNRDIKELMEARKARRAVPQIDPADTVTPPEPELAEPPAQPNEVPPVEPAPAPSDRPPENESGVDQYAKKYLVKEDERVTMTTRMYRQRRLQVDQETRDTGLEIWQIIDIGLELYFREKQKRQNR
jgi:hypothetical protein